MLNSYSLGFAPAHPVDLSGYAKLHSPAFTGTARIDGVLALSDGTAAAPALRFTDDGDTGFHRTGPDSLGLCAGGGVVLRLAGSSGQANLLAVAGGGTGTPPTLAVEGTDTAVGLRIMVKGSTDGLSQVVFVNGSGNVLARIGGGSGVPVNSVLIRAQSAGNPAQIFAEGGDSSIDLSLLPKGTGGRVRFGTYTAASDGPVTGYVEIKDAGGVTRKLAVIG